MGRGHEARLREVSPSSPARPSLNPICCLGFSWPSPWVPALYSWGPQHDRCHLLQVVRSYKATIQQTLDILFLQEGSEFLSSTDASSRDSADRTIIAWDFRSSAKISNQIFHVRNLMWHCFSVCFSCRLYLSSPRLSGIPDHFLWEMVQQAGSLEIVQVPEIPGVGVDKCRKQHLHTSPMCPLPGMATPQGKGVEGPPVRIDGGQPHSPRTPAFPPPPHPAHTGFRPTFVQCFWQEL